MQSANHLSDFLTIFWTIFDQFLSQFLDQFLGQSNIFQNPQLFYHLLVTSLALRATIQLDAICQPLVRKACLKGRQENISLVSGAISIHFFLTLFSCVLRGNRPFFSNHLFVIRFNNFENRALLYTSSNSFYKRNKISAFKITIS